MATPKIGASTSRPALMKEDQKNEELETKIVSKWSNIGDTNLGNFSVKKFREVPYIGKPSPVARRIVGSGIIKAAGFPPAIQCHELMIECARHYDPQSRSIVSKEGNTLAYLSDEAISEALHLPEHIDMIYKSLEGARSMYEDDPDTCLSIINKNWLLKSRPRLSKIPNTPHRIDFQEEYRDLITLLNRVTGAPQAFYFEKWMFFFIQVIVQGKGTIHWARIISHCLDVQLRRLKATKSFHMSSYIMYALIRSFEYVGLPHRGVIGRGPGEVRVCDSYVHLHHPPGSNYKLVNDTFTMNITRTLQGGIHNRLSQEAQELVKRYGAWFIQF